MFPTPDTARCAASPRRYRWLPLSGLLVLPAAAFLWLSCVRLDAQGLYYDELHQATGAFTYLGSPPEYFARWPVHGIPLLNMPYSGAIKTGVYGLYLRVVDPRFSVVSWRLLGVLFAVAGLVAFVWLAHPHLSPVALAVVLGLLLTDQTVLVGARHDWGPIALAFALRLILIGIWLRGDATDRPPTLRSSLALGFLVGLMMFEKLSSCVMVIALGAMIASGRRRTRRHLLAVLGGLAVGALPLILINLSSLLSHGELFSLRGPAFAPDRSWAGLARYGWGYAGLGAGDYVRHFVLGQAPPFVMSAAERALLLLALVLAGSVAFLRRREGGGRAALAALGCYAGIAVALCVFPRRTGVHHWVLGTPFQYLAIALALQSGRAFAAAPARAAARLLPIVVAILLTTRLAGLVALERALWRGDAARNWHPSLTQLGRFAADRAGEAIFIAADWGVATQIYSLSNGRPGLVHEPFWEYQGPLDLLRLQRRAGTPFLYAVSLDPPSRVKPAATERIFRDLASAPYWEELPVDPEAAGLAAVTVRKFRIQPAGAS